MSYNRPAPADVRSITCAGGGVIGAGWAAAFLARGYDVVIYDPSADAEAAAHRVIDAAWPSLEMIGLADTADRNRLRFTTDLADAVEKADFVQESAPERVEIKQKLFAAMDEAMANDVVMASSTSGLLVSDMQATSKNPARMVLGHPFNPPYILPLVEVVGGKQTDPEAVTWACEFYRHIGKHPLRMNKEIPGHIADRLQQAMWNEIAYMVAAGEATPEQIDESIVYGFGPRTAIMGYCLNYHISGGEGGIRHFFQHFAPSVADAWTRLPSPEISEDLVDAMEEGCRRLQGERSLAELQNVRDRVLIGNLANFNKYLAE